MNKFLFLTFLFFNIFRFFFSQYFSFASYIFIGIAYVHFFLFVIQYLKKHINQPINKTLILLNLFFLCQLLYHILFNNTFTSIIGYSNIVLFLNYTYLLIYMENDKIFLINCFKIFILFLCIGGIINFFISPDIFGLIDNSIYSDESKFDNINFTKRAISFIKSPQSLGFVLGLIFLTINKQKYRGKLFSALVFFVGLITFSRSFIISILIWVVNQIRVKFLYFLIICSSFIYFFEKIVGISGFDRLINFQDAVNNFVYSERFFAYTYYLKFDSIESFLFGHGIGKLSRGAEIINFNSFISSESYFIQIFYETGIVGFLFIFLFFIKTLLKSYNPLLVISLIIISFLTPSLYGFTSSFIVYFLIFINYKFKNENKRSYISL